MNHPNDRVRDGVRQLDPYRPGKPIEEVQRELGLPRIVKLASNEHSEPPFPEVQAALAAAIPDLNRYPDPASFALREAFAEVYGLPEESFFFGAGANEILELLIHAYSGGGGEVLYGAPSFPIYRLLAQSHHDVGRGVPLTHDLRHDLDAMIDAIHGSTRVVFVCNPNNPTGTYVSHDELESFLSRVPSDVLVVIDEAYVEFAVADDFPDVLSLLPQYPNLVSLRSMSKAYSLAGLRIGYLIGAPRVTATLNRVRQPFNVNRLAQVAAAVAIRQTQRVAERRQENRRQLARLQTGLEQLGCRVVPSQANFVLAFSPERNLFPGLLRQGVIVRPMHEGFGLNETAFRVNTGRDDEIDTFLAAMGQVLAVEDSMS